MDNYEFLLADYDDIPEISAIYGSLVGAPGCTWNEHYPNGETAREDIDNKALYILKKDNKIIAAASAGGFNELTELPWAPKNPCELARVAVIPSMQKQGIGTMILQKVIEAVKQQDYDGIRMLVSKGNPAALALYDRNGFERCGEVIMYDIDFYCYQMRFNPELNHKDGNKIDRKGVECLDRQCAASRRSKRIK